MNKKNEWNQVIHLFLYVIMYKHFYVFFMVENNGSLD